MHKQIKNITGQRFGRLFCTGFAFSKKYRPYFHFRCDCGTEKIIRGRNVRSGATKSCGCLHSETARAQQARTCRTHGKAKTKIYHTFNGMMDRCYNPNTPAYRNYGARGITVDPSWHTFEGFYADMGDPPTSKHTLDRIDNNAGYSKDNCRWATMKEQCNNRRSTRTISFRGETMSAKQWAERLGIPYKALHNRLSLGWSNEDALTRPMRFQKHPPIKSGRDCT